MNLYKLLGVKKRASPEEIKKAYRSLSKIHHPDKSGDSEKFRRIAEAYEVLMDPERRSRYDATGRIAPSRVTPERIKQFLRGAFQGAIKAGDDFEFENIQEKMICGIQHGLEQAQIQKREIERLIKRANGLMSRFLKKSQNDMVREIMMGEIQDLLGELHKTEDAVELAETSIEVLREYDYKVDPTSEGPSWNAGPTHRSRYFSGGRSSGSTTSNFGR